MNPAAPWLCISVVTQRWDRWWKNMSFPCFRRPVFQAEDGWVGSLSRPLSSSPYKPAHCMRDDLPQKPPIYHSAVSLQIPQGFSVSSTVPAQTDFRLQTSRSRSKNTAHGHSEHMVSGQTLAAHLCSSFPYCRVPAPQPLTQENCTPGNKQYTRLNEGNGKGRKYKWMTAGLVSTVSDCSVWPSVCIHLSGMPAPRSGFERLMDFLVQFEQMLYCQTKQVQFMSELCQFLLYY